MEYQHIPALSISIAHNNELKFNKAYGVKNLQTQIPADTNTIFHFASISKVFVGTAILKLHFDGKLSIEDPISKYIHNPTLPDTLAKQIKSN